MRRSSSISSVPDRVKLIPISFRYDRLDVLVDDSLRNRSFTLSDHSRNSCLPKNSSNSAVLGVGQVIKRCLHNIIGIDQARIRDSAPVRSRATDITEVEAVAPASVRVIPVTTSLIVLVDRSTATPFTTNSALLAVDSRLVIFSTVPEVASSVTVRWLPRAVPRTGSCRDQTRHRC